MKANYPLNTNDLQDRTVPYTGRFFLGLGSGVTGSSAAMASRADSSRTVSIHLLEAGKYVTTVSGETDTVPAHVLTGCEISLPDVFAVT